MAGLGKIKCRPNDEQRRFAGEYLEDSTVAECKSIEIAVKGQNANDRMKVSSLQICSVLVNTITVKEAKAESGKENVNATTATAMTAKNDLQLPIEVAIGCGHMHCWILSVLSVIWTFARKRGVAACPGMQGLPATTGNSMLLCVVGLFRRLAPALGRLPVQLFGFLRRAVAVSIGIESAVRSLAATQTGPGVRPVTTGSFSAPLGRHRQACRPDPTLRATLR